MLSTYASASRGTPVWQYLFKPSTLPVVHHGDEVPFVFQSSNLKGKENIALGQAMAELNASRDAHGHDASTLRAELTLAQVEKEAVTQRLVDALADLLP